MSSFTVGEEAIDFVLDDNDGFVLGGFMHTAADMSEWWPRLADTWYVFTMDP